MDPAYNALMEHKFEKSISIIENSSLSIQRTQHFSFYFFAPKLIYYKKVLTWQQAEIQLFIKGKEVLKAKIEKTKEFNMLKSMPQD